MNPDDGDGAGSGVGACTSAAASGGGARGATWGGGGERSRLRLPLAAVDPYGGERALPRGAQLNQGVAARHHVVEDGAALLGPALHGGRLQRLPLPQDPSACALLRHTRAQALDLAHESVVVLEHARPRLEHVDQVLERVRAEGHRDEVGLLGRVDVDEPPAETSSCDLQLLSRPYERARLVGQYLLELPQAAPRRRELTLEAGELDAEPADVRLDRVDLPALRRDVCRKRLFPGARLRRPVTGARRVVAVGARDSCDGRRRDEDGREQRTDAKPQHPATRGPFRRRRAAA